MKYVLIAIAWLNQQPAFTEFDDKPACEAAAEFINSGARVKSEGTSTYKGMSAQCFPKATTKP